MVYSRRSWANDSEKAAWVAGMEQRFPRLKGRLTAFAVPLDRPTFRHPQTAAEIKQLVTRALDTTMKARHGSDFASATPEGQTGLLDQIAYQKNRSPELDPGIDFFILARRMTVDGFYTSATGMRDLYPGNVALAEYKVPQEAYDYVLSRSPLK